MSRRRRPGSEEGGESVQRGARRRQRPAATAAAVPAAKPLSRREFINGTLVGALGLSAGTLLGGAAGGADANLAVARRTLRPRATAPACPTLRASDKGDRYELCHGLTRGGRRQPTCFAGTPPASGQLYDAIIIGGGTERAGRGVAAAKLKHDNILVLEKNDTVGGYCRDEQSERQPAASPPPTRSIRTLPPSSSCTAISAW